MTKSHESDQPLENIAVIGLAGCFPGASNIDQFWRNLCAGVESISHFTDDEHEWPDWADHGGQLVKAKGILGEAELFDAAFFGYTPEEAKVMDPQHRLFLERGWEAIEHAGYNGEAYPGSIGVFGGVSANTYAMARLIQNPRSGPGLLTDKDFLTTRLSYQLNLRGPSIVVQSACSTSLVAVCLACQSLLNYQCDMALAGGATVWSPTKSGYPYLPGGPLSPDGHCRAFDAGARGFVPGSGVGAVVLKRLSEAQADGDTIWAVIKGSALNNDGSGKVGYSAPSIDGQAEVIALAQELAGIDPETITYIEAHGTGTELGDPVEVAALTQAFRRSTQRTGFCRIGSVKTNIGHCDAAAGIASLTKVILALKHQQLPPSLHFERPNPKIDFAASPFVVNSRLTDWRPDSIPRRAGVSSFGVGGTNAHVVLEEAPPQSPAAPARPWQVLLLSAKSPAALDATATNLADHLQQNPDVNLADAAYTLQIGRKSFAHRRAVVAKDAADAVAALRGSRPNQSASRVCSAGRRQVVFMFPGQGAQHPGMARELYDSELLFRQMVDRCCELLRPELGLDLRTVIYPPASDEKAAGRLTQTVLAQPAIFVIEYALAELWKSWGVEPAASIGHSVGEYVAACLAGVFDLPAALRLVATRARLMNQMPAGAMLAVRRGEAEIRPLLGGGISLAAVNGTSLSVLSGTIPAIDALESRLQSEGVATVRLHASHAFHSAMMDPILAEFERVVARVGLREPTLPYLSNLTGDWIESSAPIDPTYWSRHLRQTVRFSSGLELLLSQDHVLLEVGPGRTLSGLASSHPACSTDRVVAASLRHPQQSQSDLASLLMAAGQLWLGGVAIDWNRLHQPQSDQPHNRRRVPLPTYPFQRQRYWALDEASDAGSPSAIAKRKLDPAEWFYAPSWKRLPAIAAATNKKSWLVFADGAGLADRVLPMLNKQAGQPIIVEPGAGFRQLDENRFQLDPLAKGDYAALIRQLRDQQIVPETVAYLWGVTQGNVIAASNADLTAAAGREGFYSLLYFAQALAEAGVRSPIKLAIVTDGAHDVLGDEPLHPEKALVQGPCRVLPQEFANITCRHIDLQATPGTIDDVLARGLVAEIAAEATDPVVALRRGQRWAQTYEPLPIAIGKSEDLARLHKGRVYLVTGGLGGMGLVLAQWLADTVQARLVLTARTALPRRESWSAWLAEHEASDATSRKIRGVQALEQAGAEVLVLAADVCDAAQMQSAVERAHQQFGPIHGVIHAAGVAGGGIVQLKTREMAERVLKPKVDGTRILAQALAGQPLDFFVLCSSLSALVGGFGQIDYCSANAYLDAYARQQRTSGGPPVIAINWNAWRDVGMAVETELPAALKELRKQVGLADSVSNEEGAQAFRRILSGCHESQVAISRLDLAALVEQERRARRLDETTLPARSAALQPRPDLATAYVPPATETEQAVAEIWSAIFGFDRVGLHDDFFQLGGHSLMALQLLEKLRARFGVSLALADLFEHQTLDALARHIDTLVWAAQPATGGANEVATDQREEITI